MHFHSRFTKNLSPEQINLSTLKGEGTLLSLQLDEAVLTELLELPAWMRISSATCARALFRVHWTKLKSMPIELVNFFFVISQRSLSVIINVRINILELRRRSNYCRDVF